MGDYSGLQMSYDIYVLWAQIRKVTITQIYLVSPYTFWNIAYPNKYCFKNIFDSIAIAVNSI